MASSSGKWYSSVTPRNINSTDNEPMQNIFADILALWAAVFGGTGSIVSNAIAAVTGTFSGALSALSASFTSATITTLTAKNAIVVNSTVGANAISIPNGDKTIMITAAGVSAMTIANPTAGTHDGLRLTFLSITAQAHTLDNSAGAGFNAGGAGSDIGTFGGARGDNMVIEAYNGAWYVVSKTNVTLA